MDKEKFDALLVARIKDAACELKLSLETSNTNDIWFQKGRREAFNEARILLREAV